jgi:hypothetical protein
MEPAALTQTSGGGEDGDRPGLARGTRYMQEVWTMRSFLKRRPSPALVVSLIALFCSLGGVSYAVATGSIDSREIKNNTVRSKDIRNNDVRSRDVRNSSLLARDFRPGQLPAGPRGPQGPAGAGGPAGQDGFGLLAYPFDAAQVADGATADVVTDCPTGTFATGGDTFAIDASDADVTNQVLVSQGFNFGTTLGWGATVTNNTGGAVAVGVEAACANANRVTIESKTRRLRR